MSQNKKKLLLGVVAIAILGCLLTGCTTKEERLEKQEAYRKIGIEAMEEGDYVAAMEAFNHALEQARGIGANEIDICYYKAAAQFAAGSYIAAIETYNALLEYDDKSSNTYFLRGCVYLQNNESAKALEDYKLAVKYAEDDEIYITIYDTLKGAGYEAEGKSFIEEALEKKASGNARNYTVKGRIYYSKGKYKKATEEFTTAIEKGDVEANLYLAQTYEALDKPEKANACIEAYVAAKPESSVAYNQQGCKAMEAGNYENAVSYFSQGLELPEITNEQELRRNLIAAYEYCGDFETAKVKMQEYLEDYPEDAAAEREYLFLGKNRNEETNIE